MASVDQAYENLLALLNTLVFNPSKRYVSADDELLAIQTAATMWSRDVGGLRVIDTSTVSVSGQRDYALNNQIKDVIEAQFITGINTATEAITPLEIYTEKDIDFIRSISSPIPNRYDQTAVTLTGTNSDAPKYALFYPETHTLRVFDTPNSSGATFKLWVLALSVKLGPSIVYDGEASDLAGIAFKAAELLSRRLKQHVEAREFAASYANEVREARKFRAKARQVRQIQDGRFEKTRVRSIQGSL